MLIRVSGYRFFPSEEPFSRPRSITPPHRFPSPLTCSVDSTGLALLPDHHRRSVRWSRWCGTAHQQLALYGSRRRRPDGGCSPCSPPWSFPCPGVSAEDPHSSVLAAAPWHRSDSTRLRIDIACPRLQAGQIRPSGKPPADAIEDDGWISAAWKLKESTVSTTTPTTLQDCSVIDLRGSRNPPQQPLDWSPPGVIPPVPHDPPGVAGIPKTFAYDLGSSSPEHHLDKTEASSLLRTSCIDKLPSIASTEIRLFIS